MRILLLSFYYPQDIGPGSLRAKSIVDALIEEGPSDLKIDVITTMPNRYHSFKVSALQYEANSKISINRISIPKHKSGMFDQAKAFFSFSLKVRKLILKKKWDIVVVTSSRLMTASLGAWIAKKKKLRDFILNNYSNSIKRKKLNVFFKKYL